MAWGTRRGFRRNGARKREEEDCDEHRELREVRKAVEDGQQLGPRVREVVAHAQQPQPREEQRAHLAPARQPRLAQLAEQVVVDIVTAGINSRCITASIVVGTGDLSELALGWAPFNAAQMANYNVNASVPKTLMAYLVRWYAQHRAQTDLAVVLQAVLDTPISPELIPPKNGEISQRTEDLVGPYEPHDCSSYHWLRFGASPTKIIALACRSYQG